MTIAAAYLTSEGVVFGADSTSSIVKSDGNTVQLINHAQKVFEIGENGCYALCTYGDGKVGQASHRTIAALLADEMAAQRPSKLDDASEILLSILDNKLPPEGAGLLGYLLGGVDPGSREPKLFIIEIQGRNFRLQRMNHGPCIAGSDIYYSRVFLGYDPRMVHMVRTALLQALPGVDQAAFEQAFEQAITAASARFAPHGWTDLPIREAVDFVHTYLHLTVKAEKFRFGSPVCGGPLEVAFITTDRRFRWARHKNFDSAIVEQQNFSG